VIAPFWLLVGLASLVLLLLGGAMLGRFGAGRHHRCTCCGREMPARPVDGLPLKTWEYRAAVAAFDAPSAEGAGR
jgi:hypothetical protein